MTLACLFCGEPEFVSLHEVWGPRDFMLETCCEGMDEEVRRTLADDPAEAARMLRSLDIEAICGHTLRRVADDDGHLVLDWELEVRAIEQGAAKAFIREHHEHNPPPAGDRFRAGVWNGPDLVGVVMVGRPVARAIDHTTTVEVNRLCVDRRVPEAIRWKACSTLYRWAAEEAGRRGFRRIITYTLDSESGMSLRYARWKPEATTKGGSWNTPARPRQDKAPTVKKVRWTGVVPAASPHHQPGEHP